MKIYIWYKTHTQAYKQDMTDHTHKYLENKIHYCLLWISLNKQKNDFLDD